MDNNIHDRITLFFDNALNEADKKEVLNQVSNDPAFGQMFQKEQHLREIIKSKVKRPSANSDLIQSIKDRINIT